VSAAAARQIYGVVLDGEAVDPEATRRLRCERRAAVIAGISPPSKAKGEVALQLTDNLHLRGRRGAYRTACAKCAADLGPARANYKDSCVRVDAEIGAANPNIGDWRRYIDDRPVFRQFHCPGCGALIENEIACEDDPPLQDIELSMR